MDKKPIANRLSAALVLTAFSAGAAHAETLTADAAARLALERPENAALLTADVAAARGDLVSARTWRNPVFSYQREGVDGLGGDGTENFFSVEQEVDISGRRTLSRRAAGARLTAAEHGLVDARAALRAEALTRFYDVLAAEAKATAAKSYAADLATLEKAISARVREGDASKYDLERVRQETARAPALTARARADAFAARQSLGALIGPQTVPDSAGFKGKLLPPPPGPVEPLVARAQSAPKIAVLAAKAEAAGYDERAAGRIVPDIALGAGVKTIEGPVEETGVLLSATVPLPLFDRNQGAWMRRSAEARRAAANYALARDRIAADVTALANRVGQLRRAALNYENGALSSAPELARIARISYEAGEIGVLEAIDALRSAYEAELQITSLKRDARAAHIALQELLPETEE
ncbi:MAG: TolC family protein [Alphaproteobacteria bacterium]